MSVYYWITILFVWVAAAVLSPLLFTQLFESIESNIFLNSHKKSYSY